MGITIIAEAGVNHNGSEELAYKLIDAAKASGADVVKFQIFKAEELVTEHAKQAAYQVANTGKEESQFDMLKRLELSNECHLRLSHYCQKNGIQYLSTAFDSKSLAFLSNSLKLKTLKIPSGEITNSPFILEHALTGSNIILSTGMATLGEIEQALSVIAFGLISDGTEMPNVDKFQKAYLSYEGQKALKEKVTVLHCTSEYPAPLEDVNLKAMGAISAAFGLPVGYSDHTEGIIIPVAAAACGATIIEKHFTLKKSLPGPDHIASLEPEELTAMVSSVRAVEKALGDGVKGPRSSEVKNRVMARKSIVAANDIALGQLYSEANLGIKRPGGGMNPNRYWELVGQPANKSYKKGEAIIG